MSKENTEGQQDTLIFGKQIDKTILENHPNINDEGKLKSVAGRIDDLGQRLSKLNQQGGPFAAGGPFDFAQQKPEPKQEVKAETPVETPKKASEEPITVSEDPAGLEELDDVLDDMDSIIEDEQVIDEGEAEIDNILNTMSESDFFDESTPPQVMETPQKEYDPFEEDEDTDLDLASVPSNDLSDDMDDLGQVLTDTPAETSPFAEMLSQTKPDTEAQEEENLDKNTVDNRTDLRDFHYLDDDDSNLFYTEDDFMPTQNKTETSWEYEDDETAVDAGNETSRGDVDDTPTLKMFPDYDHVVPGSEYPEEDELDLNEIADEMASETEDDMSFVDEYYNNAGEDDGAQSEASQEANTFDVDDIDSLYPDETDAGMDDHSDLEDDLDDLMSDGAIEDSAAPKDIAEKDEIEDQDTAETSSLFSFLGDKKSDEKQPVFVLKNPVGMEDDDLVAQDPIAPTVASEDTVSGKKKSARRLVIPLAASVAGIAVLVGAAYQGFLPGVSSADLPFASNQAPAIVAGNSGNTTTPALTMANSDAVPAPTGRDAFTPIAPTEMADDRMGAQGDDIVVAQADPIVPDIAEPIQEPIFITEKDPTPVMVADATSESIADMVDPEIPTSRLNDPAPSVTAGILPDAGMEPVVSDLNEPVTAGFDELDVLDDIDMLAREIESFGTAAPVSTVAPAAQTMPVGNFADADRVEEIDQKIDDALTGFEASFANIEKELSRMNGSLIAAMERNSTLAQGIEDTQRSVRAIGAIAAEFTALQESLDQTQVVLLDIASRVSAIESKNPAIAEDVDTAVEELSAEIDRLSASMAIIARMAVNGTAKMVPESQSAVAPAEPIVEVKPEAPKPRVPSLTQNPIVFETANDEAPQIEDIKIDANVRKGDFVEQYGYVLDVVPATGNQVLVIMENGSVLVSR